MSETEQDIQSRCIPLTHLRRKLSFHPSMEGVDIALYKMQTRQQRRARFQRGNREAFLKLSPLRYNMAKGTFPLAGKAPLMKQNLNIMI